MRQLETQPLSGFNDVEIDKPHTFDVRLHDGRAIDYETIVSTTPAVTSDYDGFCDPQLILHDVSQTGRWDPHANFPVGRLDDFHGRNLEVLADKVAIEDSYGNTYQSLCIKGSDLSDPHFFKSVTAERDFIIHGLQESLVMERVIRASRLLREQGVGTEYILGLAMPQRFPVPEGDGFDQTVDKTLPELLDHLSSEYATEAAKGSGIEHHPLEIKAEMMDKFKDCDYLVSYRAMDCPFRFGELTDEDKCEEFVAFVRRNNSGPLVDEYLDEFNPVRFLFYDFVPHFAENVAKMHNTGLKHGFLHKNNITMLGSLVDLDSCKGEPLGLGDDAINRRDELTDIHYCLEALEDTIGLEKDDDDYDLQEALHARDVLHYAAIYFLKDYIDCRFEDQNDKESFLCEMLLLAHGNMKNNGLLMSSLAEKAYGAYKMGAKNKADPGHIPSFKDADINLSRHKSFLRTVPASYFIEHQEMIIDDSWTLNHEHEFTRDTARPVNHIIKPLVGNLCVEQLCGLMAKEKIGGSKFLYAAHATNSLTPPEDKDSLAAKHRRDTVKPMWSRVLNRLCEYDTDSLPSNFQKLIKDRLPGLADRAALLPIPESQNESIPVLYLKENDEYLEVISNLGINEKTAIEAIGNEEVSVFLAEFEEKPANNLIVADYDMVKGVIEQTTYRELHRAFVRIYYRIRPQLFIKDFGTDKQRVCIWAIDHNEEESKKLSYEHLVSAATTGRLYPFDQPQLIQDDTQETD